MSCCPVVAVVLGCGKQVLQDGKVDGGVAVYDGSEKCDCQS